MLHVLLTFIPVGIVDVVVVDIVQPALPTPPNHNPEVLCETASGSSLDRARCVVVRDHVADACLRLRARDARDEGLRDRDARDDALRSGLHLPEHLVARLK
jgi:hypothetical protein